MKRRPQAETKLEIIDRALATNGNIYTMPRRPEIDLRPRHDPAPAHIGTSKEVAWHSFNVAPRQPIFDPDELEKFRLGLVPELPIEEGREYNLYKKNEASRQGRKNINGPPTYRELAFGNRRFKETIGKMAVSKTVEITLSVGTIDAGNDWKIEQEIELQRVILLQVYPSVEIAVDFFGKSVEAGFLILNPPTVQKYNIPKDVAGLNQPI